MADIKIKPKETIKKLDKNIVQLQKVKNNILTTKEKINEITLDENVNTAENYASNKIQNDMNYVSRKGTQKINEIGKQSLKDTKDNIIKSKEKVEDVKSKIKVKQVNKKKNISNKTKKTIKNSINKSIKTAKDTTRLTKKEIKTTEKIAKDTKEIAKESVKLSQKAAKVAQNAVQTTIKGTKTAIKVTIKTIKATVATVKTLTSLIIAGGWVAIVIILIIAIIGGFVAVIYNNSEDTSYDTSQISSNEIVLVAKSQIGNEGGDKFWSWYGFEEYVSWCACFVSWCANECGYIDKGIMPKFSACTEGIKWFKEKNQWKDGGEDYYPIVGDIIFFDWKDDDGNQDGISDHVGIVTKTDITNRTIYTIEGNTSNKCAEREYSFDDVQIMGYGTPQYE